MSNFFPLSLFLFALAYTEKKRKNEREEPVARGCVAAIDKRLTVGGWLARSEGSVGIEKNRDRARGEYITEVMHLLFGQASWQQVKCFDNYALVTQNGWIFSHRRGRRLTGLSFINEVMN